MKKFLVVTGGLVACIGFFVGLQVWIAWLTPEKRQEAMPVSRRPLLAVRSTGFLREDTAVASEGMNPNDVYVEGDVTGEYKKGLFVSFPTINHPGASQVAWQIGSATYIGKDQTTFPLTLTDVTIVTVSGDSFSGIDNIPIRLWEKDPTLDPEE